jgi:hypothetical protein
MGKQYNVNPGPITEQDNLFDKNLICSANGMLCLKGCKYEEVKSCLRLENRKKELNIK